MGSGVEFRRFGTLASWACLGSTYDSFKDTFRILSASQQVLLLSDKVLKLLQWICILDIRLPFSLNVSAYVKVHFWPSIWLLATTGNFFGRFYRDGNAGAMHAVHTTASNHLWNMQKVVFFIFSSKSEHISGKFNVTLWRAQSLLAG